MIYSNFTSRSDQKQAAKILFINFSEHWKLWRNNETYLMMIKYPLMTFKVKLTRIR